MTLQRYRYEDENRKALYSKIRIENEQGKNFYYEREENGVIVKNMQGCRKVLYCLPAVLYGVRNSATIYLVEGEKDADTLMKHMLFTTTSSSSLEWPEEFTQILKDADVVILHDYDKTGIKRRDLLCAALHGKVKRLRVVDLPGLEYREKHGQDITDWLAIEGNTIEQFKTIVEQTADYTPPVAQMPEGGLNVVSLEDLLALNLPERKMLLDPFLTEQGLIMLYAKRGVGKTHIALGIAHAVASGGTFLKWSAPQARKVLYIDGEMPAVSMQERLRKISSTASHKPPAGYLAIINQDLQTNSLPDLASKLGRDAIEPYVQDASLIVVDNISSLFRSGAENEAESWQPVQDWALDLRRRGKSILFVHHAGKSGQQRGTSKKEDTLDVVISLRQPDEYRAEEGASFELHFEKTRNFAGDHALPFHAQLIEEADGSIRWQIAPIDHDPMVIEIATLKEEGKTIAEIMIKTQLSKSQVETKIKKSKEDGSVIMISDFPIAYTHQKIRNAYPWSDLLMFGKLNNNIMQDKT